MTDADREHMVLAMEAAAAGDAASALEHELAISILPPGPSATLLREMALLGEDAPAWVWCRWAVHQAYRWLLIRQDDTVDQAVRTTLAALHGPALAQVGGEGDLLELGTLVAASDWAAQQIAVHELGGLRRFLDCKAGDKLRARAASVEAWGAAEMGGYRLDRTRGSALQVTDLSTGKVLQPLNIGALSERDEGAYVIGRIVPISAEPLGMFAARPLSVDRATAERVADASCSPDGRPWIDVLAEGVDHGRLQEWFSVGHATLLSSDLPLHWRPSDLGEADPIEDAAVLAEQHGRDEPPRLLELLDQGLSATAANGVMVCEVGLLLRDVSEGALDRFGTHLSAVLIEPEVVAAIRRVLCEPVHREFWEDMAERVPEPSRSLCRDFARRCG